jgi:DNA-binding NarL/FixJ family response regulator
MAGLALLSPAPRVVMLGDFRTKSDVMASLAAGAHGCVARGDGAAAIRTALRAVVSGDLHLSPGVRRLVLASAHGDEQARADTVPALPLTARERAVVTLIGRGKTDRQVGDLLDLDVRTVHRDRTSIAKKLGVSDTTTMIRRAIALGLIRS